jgi:hypothetical protein
LSLINLHVLDDDAWTVIESADKVNLVEEDGLLPDEFLVRGSCS